MPRAALEDAWGPAELRIPLHPENDPKLLWTVPPCSVCATLGAGDRVVRFALGNDYLPD